MAVAKKWLTLEEAAEYLCVSKRTMHKLTQQGRLPAFGISRERHRRFRKRDLDAALRAVEEGARLGRVLKLTAKASAVLAEVWDNERDAAYDRI